MPFLSIIKTLICFIGLVSATDIVLEEACPVTEFNGVIVRSNIPQPYTGVRCLTNHSGMVQTYVQTEIVYCNPNKTCVCNDSTSFKLAQNYANENSMKCEYVGLHFNNYLCACCEGYEEVDHVCVLIPPPAILPKNGNLLPVTLSSPPLIWPIIVGTILGLIVIILLIVLLVYCCCCVAAAAPVAKSEKEKKEEVIIRIENDYEDIGNGAGIKRAESDYDVIGFKFTDSHKKLIQEETLYKKSDVDKKKSETSGTAGQNIYSVEPVIARENPAETGIYEKIHDDEERKSSQSKCVETEQITRASENAVQMNADETSKVYENDAKFDTINAVYKNEDVNAESNPYLLTNVEKDNVRNEMMNEKPCNV